MKEGGFFDRFFGPKETPKSQQNTELPLVPKQSRSEKEETTLLSDIAIDRDTPDYVAGKALIHREDDSSFHILWTVQPGMKNGTPTVYIEVFPGEQHKPQDNGYIQGNEQKITDTILTFVEDERVKKLKIEMERESLEELYQGPDAIRKE